MLSPFDPKAFLVPWKKQQPTRRDKIRALMIGRGKELKSFLNKERTQSLFDVSHVGSRTVGREAAATKRSLVCQPALHAFCCIIEICLVDSCVKMCWI